MEKNKEKKDYEFCLWEVEAMDDKKYQILDNEDSNIVMDVNLFAGERIIKKIPVINFIAKKSKKIADYQQTFCGGGFKPFSKKLQEALKRLEINNIQYLDANILSKKGELLSNEYKVANILGRYNCLDLEKSEYKIYEKYQIIQSISKLVIDETKIPEEVDLFRLGEKGSIILVRKRVRDELIKEGITGVCFVEIDDYK